MPVSNFISPFSDTLLSPHGLVSLPHCHFRSFSQRTQIRIQQQHIVFAKNKRRRRGSSVSSRKIVNSAFYIASKLKILPEPFDFLIQEFGIGVGGDGNRGGISGSRKGFNWGGFDDGWVWGRHKRKLGFLVAALLISGVGLSFVVGKNLAGGDALLGTFGGGLVLFGLSIDGWRKGLKNWIVGFCCCAFLMRLVLKKQDFQRLMESSSAVLNKMKKTQTWAIAQTRRRRRI